MGKKYLGIALILVMAGLLSMAPTASAASPPTGGGVVTSGVVTNVAPVIDQTSLLIQLTDSQGVTWQWQNGSASGNRAAPYMFDGEELHIGLDVTDANGPADLNGMAVKVNLGPGINIACGIVNAASGNVTTAFYSGNLTVGSSIAQGKYSISVNATDPGGLSDSYSPPVSILIKPTLTLQISASSLSFSSSAKPGDQDITPAESPIGLTPMAVIGTEHVPVVFSISQSGTDMMSANGVIPAANTVWSFNNQPTGAAPLTATAQTIATAVKEGTTIQVYYWLDIPSSQAAGTYDGQISYQMIGN